MSINGIDTMLGELRAMSAKAAGGVAHADQEQAQPVEFAALLKSSLDQVNQAQQTSRELQKQFELGNPDTNLQDVMIAMQKASLSFETMVQVRNKLVSAYQEVMNIQV
ncbi:flagellar hook-basal body complex protein FliE [Chitinivorax tropicus]|uniref:Flagellar hook-basal body complex protein FliE n=1 Tax=Chitinivorax tropicus TaxID=714531 RepID=A0A840MR20_9PROT|nr:flagellar hook-basal body complex protein FliE [Chitinivorax tropicus]MBB5019875.1 flagellar hook-basal body complex protein FliE [Chitinivorax tropicus]